MTTTFTPNEFFYKANKMETIDRAKLRRKCRVLRGIKTLLLIEAEAAKKQGDDLTTINEQVCKLKFSLLNKAGASNYEFDDLEAWAKRENLY